MRYDGSRFVMNYIRELFATLNTFPCLPVEERRPPLPLRRGLGHGAAELVEGEALGWALNL